MSDVWHRLASPQQAIEAALTDSLNRFTPDAPPRLVEAMRYSLLGGGKRLRPLLSILACEATGGSMTLAMPAAVAVEMVHTYSLIHDDLPAMDDDDLRRGRPSCHKQFDEATAILAGDALLTMAFEVLASGCPAATAAVSTLELARGAGAVGMVGGQVLDLEAGDDLEAIHRRKTGALFRASLRLGLYAAQAKAGINPDALATVDAYSEAFGLAFQITDDLLDVESTPEKAGKRVNKDAERGKRTYPSVFGVDESRSRAHTLCGKAVASANDLGPAGKPLAELAQYLSTRDR